MSARIPLLLGTGNIGEEGKMGVRISDIHVFQDLVDIFLDAKYTEIDTSRIYGSGTSEAYLSKLKLRDAQIDTKAYPLAPGDHTASKLRETFLTSLKTLGRKKVHAFYLHAPDHATPFEDTVKEIDALHREGLFEQFGLSNFASWEVAEIVGIAKANNYILPTVYQSLYNGITRPIESELVPCLRKFNIRLTVFNPLAGGFLVGNLKSATDETEKGGRFDPSTGFGKNHRAWYVKDQYFAANNIIRKIAAEHQLTMVEIALRWLQHHSALLPTDGVILGASSAKQLQQNIIDSEKGPLPEPVVHAMEEAWQTIGTSYTPYFR